MTLIKGSNGAGKTSLLKVITREIPLISGELKWFISPDDVIYSPQAAGLFNRTLLENIMYSSSSSMAVAFDGILPDSLKNRLNEVVGTQSMKLSGGERQILSNLRAMNSSAEVYIFDEPTAHLDGQAQVRFYETIRAHFKNKTVVIVDHNQVAEEYCDESMVLEVVSGGQVSPCGAIITPQGDT